MLYHILNIIISYWFILQYITSLCYPFLGSTTYHIWVPTTVARRFSESRSPAAHFVQQLATGWFDVQGLAETGAWHGHATRRGPRNDFCVEPRSRWCVEPNCGESVTGWDGVGIATPPKKWKTVFWIFFYLDFSWISVILLFGLLLAYCRTWASEKCPPCWWLGLEFILLLGLNDHIYNLQSTMDTLEIVAEVRNMARRGCSGVAPDACCPVFPLTTPGFQISLY